jgi:hypothetical protein
MNGRCVSYSMLPEEYVSSLQICFAELEVRIIAQEQSSHSIGQLLNTEQVEQYGGISDVRSGARSYCDRTRRRSPRDESHASVEAGPADVVKARDIAVEADTDPDTEAA